MDRIIRKIIHAGRWAAVLFVWSVGITPFAAGAVLSIVVHSFVMGWNELKTTFFHE